MNVRTGLVLLLIIMWVTLASAIAARVWRWRHPRPARPERPMSVCGNYGDDGLTVCGQCRQVGPHSQFEPYTKRERIGLAQWVPVTYYQCKGGCWPWPR